KHRGWVLWGTAAMTAASIWAAAGVRVETNLLEFFKENAPVRISLDFVEKKMSGVSTLDVWFEADKEDAFREPENLKLIEEVQEKIGALKGVDKTLSAVDFMKEMNESFNNEDKRFYRVPESREMVSQYLLIYDSDEMENLVNPSYDQARISVRMAVHGSRDQKGIAEKVKEILEGAKRPGVKARVTGRAIRDVNTIEALVNGQIYSLAMAAGVISLIMFAVLRSASVAFLSMLPNIFPIILNFGIMGAAGISLDTGTALISAVALGIAVDDTIHLLTGYLEGRKAGLAGTEAMILSMKTRGRAVISSSVILCIGFGVMAASRFVPTMHFGILSAVIMITALVGDVVLLPALIFRKEVQN
ncbi:MAG: MMPL family transporter, partial [Thermodesulfobacteriota bacterium]